MSINSTRGISSRKSQKHGCERLCFPVNWPQCLPGIRRIRSGRVLLAWARPLQLRLDLSLRGAFKGPLFGRRYKPRSGPERTFVLPESWKAGLTGAILLVLFALLSFANVTNRVIGTPHASLYEVTGNYVFRCKHTCYGLTLASADDLAEQLKICVSRQRQDATSIGDVLQVSDRRSRGFVALRTWGRERAKLRGLLRSRERRIFQ